MLVRVNNMSVCVCIRSVVSHGICCCFFVDEVGANGEVRILWLTRRRWSEIVESQITVYGIEESADCDVRQRAVVYFTSI